MTTSHVLKYNAAPYNAEGELLFPADTGVTRGPGRAKCACGALSPQLDNGAQRRQWFKTHKANPETWTRTDTSVEWVADEIPLDPEPVAEAPAAAPVVDVVEDAPADDQEDAEPVFSRVVPFTKDSPDSFWRFLGRDGVRRLAAAGVLGPVTVSTNASNHTLLVGGQTERQVVTACGLIEQYWREALDSVKEWKQTDPAFLARPKKGLEGRKASYFMTGEYYLAYADKYIQDQAA